MDIKLQKLIGKKVKHIETEYADCAFYSVYKEEE